MNRKLKLLGALCAVGVLAACAGTGTTNPDQVNSLIRQADGNTTIVARNTGFAGSAVRISVLLDGEKVASLGNNEVGFFQAPPGKHTLALDFEGIDIGLKTNELVYNNDPSRPQYFAINLTQNFLTSQLTITEVSAESFPAQFGR